MSGLKVSEVASRVGVGPDTIRFYEKEGLLPEPARSPAGYREFDETVIERLELIRGAQAAGLRLAEIRELLEIRDRRQCPCGHTQSIVKHRLQEISAEMAKLRSFKRRLEELLEAGSECSSEDFWPCEANFIEAGKESRG